MEWTKSSEPKRSAHLPRSFTNQFIELRICVQGLQSGEARRDHRRFVPNMKVMPWHTWQRVQVQFVICRTSEEKKETAWHCLKPLGPCAASTGHSKLQAVAKLQVTVTKRLIHPRGNHVQKEQYSMGSKHTHTAHYSTQADFRNPAPFAKQSRLSPRVSKGHCEGRPSSACLMCCAMSFCSLCFWT